MALLPFGSPIKLLRQLWSSVPASPTASGSAGDAAYDDSYLYVATAINTWKRTALSTWSTVDSFLLMETGDFLLLETGDKLVLE